MINAIFSLVLGLIINSMSKQPMYQVLIVPVVCFFVNAVELILYLVNRFTGAKRFLKATGKKKLAAQLRCTRFYPYLVFFTVTIFPAAKVFSVILGIIILLAVIFELMMKAQVNGEVAFLRKELLPEDKVVIVQANSCLKPTSYARLLYDNLLAYVLYEIGGQTVFEKRYKGYVFVNNITALMCEDLLRSHHKSLLINAFQIRKFYVKGAKTPLAHSMYFACDTVLCVDKTGKSGDDWQLPYPDKKVHHIRDMESLDFTATLVSQLENKSSVPAMVQKLFGEMAEEAHTDAGKQYLCRLIKQMLEGVQKDTEYFYELMKICEFIVHYKALGDYEEVGAHYFDGPCSASFGILASSVCDTTITDTLRSDAYKEALRFISMLTTGTSGDYSKKRPAYTGRMRMVNLRNRYVGHGTMTYSVSEELTGQVLIVVHALCEEFLLAKEPVMVTGRINNAIDKCVIKGESLYLLTAIYDDNGACQYIDYSTGMMLTAGNTLTIQLDR